MQTVRHVFSAVIMHSVIQIENSGWFAVNNTGKVISSIDDGVIEVAAK